MAKKREYEFIMFVLLIVIIGGIAIGPIIKPESVGEFIHDFVGVSLLLTIVPVLIITWRNTSVQISTTSKKGLYYWWGLAVLLVLAAGLHIWNIRGVVRGEEKIMEKAVDIMFPLYLCAWTFIYIVKYIRGGRAGTEPKE